MPGRSRGSLTQGRSVPGNVRTASCHEHTMPQPMVARFSCDSLPQPASHGSFPIAHAGSCGRGGQPAQRSPRNSLDRRPMDPRRAAPRQTLLARSPNRAVNLRHVAAA